MEEIAELLLFFSPIANLLSVNSMGIQVNFISFLQKIYRSCLFVLSFNQHLIILFPTIIIQVYRKSILIDLQEYWK